jgi:hypothetical protein
MALANALVYKGQLQSGGPAVEDAQLQLPRPAALQQVSSQSPGLRISCALWCLPVACSSSALLAADGCKASEPRFCQLSPCF